MRDVAGLSERELARVRGRLVEFSEGDVRFDAAEGSAPVGRGVSAGFDVGWEAEVDRADGGEAG